MTIHFIYTGYDDIAHAPLTVIAGTSVHTIASNEVCIEGADNTDCVILKEAWIKTKPYRLPSGKKQITIMWNKSGSLLLALVQMLVFRCSSFYFKVFIDDEKRVAQWHKRNNSFVRTTGGRFFYLLPVRLCLECGIVAVCGWCGSFLGRMIVAFFR
ncbi:MAG: hypothetical protein ACTTJ7_09170 [Treponema sp.]